MKSGSKEPALDWWPHNAIEIQFSSLFPSLPPNWVPFHGPNMAAHLHSLHLLSRQKNRSRQGKSTKPCKWWEPHVMPIKGLPQKYHLASFVHTVWTRLCHMEDEIISQGYSYIEQNQNHISKEEEKIDVW